MQDHFQHSQRTLRKVMRPLPTLAPEDSLGRFVQTQRFLGADGLPVHRDGRLCGVIWQDDVLPILASHDETDRTESLQLPIARAMRTPEVLARPDMTPDEVGRLMAEHRVATVPVVDGDGFCLGVVLASDLLIPETHLPMPQRVGGMATPFGVYLTDGVHQAGVGNGALIATGAAIGGLLLFSYFLMEQGILLLQKTGMLSSSAMWNLNAEPSADQPLHGLAHLVLRVVLLLLFLTLMRLTRIAGFHAAEHQTVHAIERNEPLVPEIVARMPRAHPRCGTNLMAAGIVFFLVTNALRYVPYVGIEDAAVLAAMVTMFVWRPVGTFLQERFTTRPARPKELASGIAAGKQLLHKYHHLPPARVKWARRLWNMGLVQTLMGTLLVFTAASFFIK
jgi:CBS domain-containing protein